MRLSTEESDELLRTSENACGSPTNLVLSETTNEATTNTKRDASGYTNGYSRTLTNGNGVAANETTSPRKAKSNHRTSQFDSPKSSVHRLDLPGTRLNDDSCIDREEFIRLVIQSLRDVGYLESALTLEAESGYRMESTEVTRFRACILDGHWTEAEEYLPILGVTDPIALRAARFLISQQKYLELLEAQSINPALHVLRNELASLNIDTDDLHSLSSLIMCSNSDDLRHRAKWDGVNGSSRRNLLLQLQRFIKPSTMIPLRRFTTLIDQAFAHQRTNCLYHNAPFRPESFSLYTDHTCSRESFPLLTTKILKEHLDEVWNIKWSHDGLYLASASKDRSAFIWRISPESEKHEHAGSLERKLEGHQFTVGCLAWSPDDALLLTSTDNIIKVWNVKAGICIGEKDAHQETVSALEWLPDGSGFLSGGMDRKILLWDANGTREALWMKTSVRVTDLAVASDLSRMVIVGLDCIPSASTKPSLLQDTTSNVQATTAGSTENRLIIYDYASRNEEASIRLDGELTSVKISQDSRYALVNHAPDEVQLWDLETARMARKFTGQRQGQHIIRSCFGGVDGNFVVSGSEDGRVYVWHRETGALLEILKGHGEGSVNAVAWNPKNERMFASCSDDQTIRIWESPSADIFGTEMKDTVSSAEGIGKGKGRESTGWTAAGPSGISLILAS